MTIETLMASMPHTHSATLNGERVTFHESDYDSAVARLVAEHGPGVPAIAKLDAEPKLTDEQVHAAIVGGMRSDGPLPQLAPEYVETQAAVGKQDQAGRERALADRAAAIAAGFAPARPLFRTGSRASGMNAHVDAFNQLPLVGPAMEDLQEIVRAEERTDRTVLVNNVSMEPDGTVIVEGEPTAVCERAIGNLAERCGAPTGAASYLTKCWPELRALNFEAWRTNLLSATETANADALVRWSTEPNVYKRGPRPVPASNRVTLRTRRSAADTGATGREVFAAVSDSYGEFDADRIAEAVEIAMGGGRMRAEVAYDGFRTRIDLLAMSDIKPSHAVAGEIFKAGISIRTDDTGGGGIRVSAAVWQNLCLNFIIIDRAEVRIASVRHTGNAVNLAHRFQEALRKAQSRIDYFVKAWGFAQEENVLERSLAAASRFGEDMSSVDAWMKAGAPVPVSVALPGIFAGMIERDLVPLPKRAVPDLVRMFEEDTSAAVRNREVLTRAAVVNAVTRYAHEVNGDPWKAGEIERAAGRLLSGTRGADARSGSDMPVLPWVATT